MRDALEQRRDELARELRAGQEMLADLDNRRAELQQTMLRISGALQVLEELLGAGAARASAQEPAPGAMPAADAVPAEASPAPSLVAG